MTDDKDTDYTPAEKHGTADLLEEGFFFMDEDSDSDSEYGEEDHIDEEELTKLKTKDGIHCFNAILAEAQAVAIQAAKEAGKSKLNGKGITWEI